ncbi:MAG: DUF3786 domain-containing protein [Syntrophobacteraceae bacterium]
MARIDDYKEAFRLAALELKKRDPAVLAKAAGIDIMEYDGGSVLKVPYLGTDYMVRFSPEPDIRKLDSTEEVPVPDKVLISHYLLGASGKKPSGNLITFRQVPDGKFYFEAFQKRARDPFLEFFAGNGRFFKTCAGIMGAVPVETGDYGMRFRVLPMIEVQLVLWEGDEEFPADATILFDDTIQLHLSAEDIAVLSGSLVYRLIGLARKLQAGA